MDCGNVNSVAGEMLIHSFFSVCKQPGFKIFLLIGPIAALMPLGEGDYLAVYKMVKPATP